jgi:hypothetical protein
MNIVCYTEEAANEVLQILHNRGYKWNGGGSLLSYNNWSFKDFIVYITNEETKTVSTKFKSLMSNNEELTKAIDFLALNRNMGDLKIDNNTVVHCKTEELAKQVLKIAYKLGYKWSNGASFLYEHKWNLFKDLSHYFLHEGFVAKRDFFGINYKIISAQEFIDLHDIEEQNIALYKKEMEDAGYKFDTMTVDDINKGQKFDEGKLPMFTVLVKQFPNAVKEIVKCSQAGHIKYPKDIDWLNYRRVDLTDNPNRYLDAAVRHLFESKGELKLNEDMKEYGEVSHLAQVAWNILAHLEIKLNDKTRH